MDEMIATIEDTRFGNTDPIKLYKTRYTTDGSTALYGVNSAGGKFAVYTVNLSDYFLTPTDGQVYIKEYSEGKGNTAVLEKAGIITPIDIMRIGDHRATVTIAALNI